MIRDYRKPLIVVAPKILLRHPSATSFLSDFGPSTNFKAVIGMLFLFPFAFENNMKSITPFLFLI